VPDGSQVFFDNFRDSQPLTPVTSLLPELSAINVTNHDYIREFENDKWRVRTYGADNVSSRVFIMNNHAMDTLYDGPYAMHNNNASLVWMPKATHDISGGKVLHVHFRVDAHMNGRRWWDVFVSEAGDTLLDAAPTKMGPTDLPSAKGNLLFWQIQTAHSVQLVRPTVPPAAKGNTITDLTQVKQGDGSVDRSYWSQVWTKQPAANGYAMALDKMSTFDLYLSQTHYRIVETLPDGSRQIVRDMDFPAGVTLPITNCQVGLTHELYHTGNDRPETVKYYSEESYWYNFRPWADQRHMDDVSVSVLDSFPPLPAPAK
jgi:hypothetical protein